MVGAAATAKLQEPKHVRTRGQLDGRPELLTCTKTLTGPICGQTISWCSTLLISTLLDLLPSAVGACTAVTHNSVTG